MISWLQTVIQRNHKLLFGILLIVIIIAFVFTVGNFGGGPGPGLAPDQRQQQFYGFDLSNPRVRTDLTRWTDLSMRLNLVPLQSITQEQYTFAVLQRALGLHLADELQIPDPSDRQFARFMQNVPAFLDPQTGVFSHNQSQQVIDTFNSNPQLGEGLLTLVLIQDYRIEQALKVLGGPGYVLPQLAENSLRTSRTEWALEVATLPRPAAGSQKIELSNADLEAYYEQNKESYKPEDKIIGGYVLLPSANYAASVGTPTAAQLEAFYKENTARWPLGADGKPQSFEQLGGEVAKAWKEAKELEKAEAAANQLTLAVYNAATSGKLTGTPESIEAFLKGQNLELTALPAFNQSTLAATGAADAAQTVIKQRILGLQSQGRFYSDAILLDNGAALAFVLGQENSVIPPFAQVREQVVSELTAVRSAEQFAKLGQEVQAALTKAVAEGKPFAQTAESLKLKVSKIAPFSLMSPPQDLNPYYLFAVMELPQGGVSQLLSDAQGSSVVYVAAKKEPEIAADSAELTQAIAQLRPTIQRATASSIINELMNVGEQQDEEIQY